MATSPSGCWRATFPWSKLRQGQKLLRLAERYTAERLDAACARALGFDLVDVRRVERILVLALEHEGQPAPPADQRVQATCQPAASPDPVAPSTTAFTRGDVARQRGGAVMSVDADLVRLLKRLKLGQLVPTLPERLTLASAQQLDYAPFLTLLLADEVQRREQQALERHLLQAGFEERITLDALIGLPVSSIAVNSSTSSRCSSWSARSTSSSSDPSASARRSWSRRWAPPPCAPATASCSCAPTRCSKISARRAPTTPSKGLPPLPGARPAHPGRLRAAPPDRSAEQRPVRADHRASPPRSFAITSNRGVDEWLGLFDDPILGNSALDRLANAAHQLVIEGPSYRAKLAPKHRDRGPAMTPSTDMPMRDGSRDG